MTAFAERVWLKLDDVEADSWSPATLTSRTGDDVEVLADSGERRVVKPSAVLPQNADAQDLAPDLAQLVHLSEPCLLHTLGSRYAAGEIYTYTGTILIALNPWRSLPLYDAEQARAPRCRRAVAAPSRRHL